MKLRICYSAPFRRIAFTVGLICSFGADVLPGAQAASVAMSASFLNLRTAPAPTSTIRSIVPPAASLTVSGDREGDYFPVVYGEQAGWVAVDLVRVDAPTPSALAASFDESQVLPDGVATLSESLNLRSGPGVDYEAIKVVDAGSRVEATGDVSGDYEKIRFDGHEGWVRSIYVDRGPGTEVQELRETEIRSALQVAGRPLVGPEAMAVADAEIVLREQPRPSGTKLAVVPAKSKLTVTGNERDGYLEIRFEGKSGWVASGYLRLLDLPTANSPAVPVLMYHSIQQNGAEYQVTASQLEEQLRWLSRNDYQSITSADLLGWLTYGVPLPAKPVIISIDDGNSSDWLFLELLERYGFEGVFSLPDYAQLSPRQIRTLDRAGEVCGHTVSHQNLSTLSYDDQVYQIVENKKYLEKILGHPITCFSYPFGAYSGLTPYVVIEAGYLVAFNVDGGPQPLDESIDRWHVRRINVNGNGTLDDFIASLQV